MCCNGKSNATPETKQEKLGKLLQSLPSLPGEVHQIQQLQRLLPVDDGQPRTYGRPTFHPDGSIEFPRQDGAPPKDMNGFRRDEENPFHFRTLWGECQLRMQGAQLNKTTGEIAVKMVCNNQEATTFQKFVTAQQCADCPVRSLRKNPEKSES